MKTVNDFIKELQSISKDKKELPIVIVCPNGMSVYPSIKLRLKDMFNSKQSLEAIVITWYE
jgi:hypothetical protein